MNAVAEVIEASPVKASIAPMLDGDLPADSACPLDDVARFLASMGIKP